MSSLWLCVGVRWMDQPSTSSVSNLKSAAHSYAPDTTQGATMNPKLWMLYMNAVTAKDTVIEDMEVDINDLDALDKVIEGIYENWCSDPNLETILTSNYTLRWGEPEYRLVWTCVCTGRSESCWYGRRFEALAVTYLSNKEGFIRQARTTRLWIYDHPDDNGDRYKEVIDETLVDL
jgi:hypothetical protein